MPAFVYRAVDGAGARHKGVIEAPSAAGARRLLRERALLPLSVEAARGRGAPVLRRGVGLRQLAAVTRQLATLVGSDINVEEALRLAAEQAGQAALRSTLLDLRGAILEGRSFAAALGDHPAAFPDYYRASIAAGERSGRLAEVLAHLADFVEHRQRNRHRLRLALLYPALLAVVSFAMIALLLVYVVPDIVRVFVSRGASLPLVTRGLIATSEALQAYGLVILALLAAGTLAAGRWLGAPANRLRADAWIARTPPFARLSRQHNAARFAASLATLVQSAVPLVDAIAAAAAVTPNRHVRARALGVAARIGEGASLRTAMAEAEVFPPALVAIVASGESSGRLGPALARAAAELEREHEALVATLVALVEPGVLLLMGGIVLTMVLAILLPIIGLNDLVAL